MIMLRRDSKKYVLLRGFLLSVRILLFDKYLMIRKELLLLIPVDFTKSAELKIGVENKKSNTINLL